MKTRRRHRKMQTKRVVPFLDARAVRGPGWFRFREVWYKQMTIAYYEQRSFAFSYTIKLSTRHRFWYWYGDFGERREGPWPDSVRTLTQAKVWAVTMLRMGHFNMQG